MMFHTCTYARLLLCGSDVLVSNTFDLANQKLNEREPRSSATIVPFQLLGSSMAIKRLVTPRVAQREM